MDLTRTERAKITDSLHSIQSAQASLAEVDESKVPEVNEIQECLKGADKNLRHALRNATTEKS